MKVVSTEALTKLIQLVKSAFIKVDDVVEVTEIETETPNEITLATVATSGSYNDLSDKPTIPAAQVNSDWNATSGVARILNKPTIPTVNNASLIIQKNGTNVATFTANASSNVTANISVPNTVSSVSSSSTNAEAVGAKLFYDTCGDIETALHTINSGGGSTNYSGGGSSN